MLMAVDRMRNPRLVRVCRGVTLALVLLAVGGCSRETSSQAGADPEGKATASARAARGSVTLSWIPPRANLDGTPLTDLAGYRIYYGTSPDYLQRVIELDDPGATRHTIEGLPPYTYYFVIKAYNSRGAESAASNMVTKTID